MPFYLAYFVCLVARHWYVTENSGLLSIQSKIIVSKILYIKHLLAGYLGGHHLFVPIRVSLLSLPLFSGHPTFKHFVLERAMADKSLKLKVHDE